MKQIIPTILILSLVTVLVSTILYSIRWQQQHIQGTVLSVTNEKKGNEVIGFIPYWSMEEIESLPYSELTELIYFGVTIQEDGSILREHEEKNELGWYTLYSDTFNTMHRIAKRNDVRVSVALKPHETSDIGAIVRSKQAQDTLYNEVSRMIYLRNLDGINVDFEFAHGDSSNLSDEYFAFLETFFFRLHEEFPHLTLSFDEFPNTLIHANPKAVKKTLLASDYLLIMGYDFHAGRSTQAGPVAPLSGEEGEINSLTGTLTQVQRTYPMGEFVLGIPLYGYLWQTETPEQHATTLPDTAVAIPYDYTKTVPPHLVRWDDQAASPWYSFQEDNAYYQLYFENTESMQRKIALQQEYGMHGIAFWSLDMAAQSPELWGEILGRKE